MKTEQENEKRTQENQWNKEPSDLWNAQQTEIEIRDGFKKSGNLYPVIMILMHGDLEKTRHLRTRNKNQVAPKKGTIPL